MEFTEITQDLEDGEPPAKLFSLFRPKFVWFSNMHQREESWFQASNGQSY